MNITFTVNNPVKAGELLDVFKSVGWDRSAHDIVAAFENSYYVCAWDRKKLVGFARAISDRYYYTSIFDVVIRPKFQKKVSQNPDAYPAGRVFRHLFLFVIHRR